MRGFPSGAGAHDFGSQLTRVVKDFDEVVSIVGEVTLTYAAKLGLMMAGIHRYAHWEMPEACGQHCYLVQEVPISTRLRPRIYLCFDEDFA